ncbi:TonB-dependent receptor [Spirosoma sp. KCTC 42546]|uniref:SusC/RagA family TonB-linked outer membrane protein n=1 Tax=Spirosoma sp. KCTC 42546 TaxID=2520506 RepID=UPI001158B2A1|nr:TonB-dependent receptor [Spirosoma sp. KCTC 42546]QDK79937.1 TonB-dependent receptor [Spirosoma sp. KCTC 42546]
MKKWLLSGCWGAFLFSFSPAPAQLLATTHIKQPVYQNRSQSIRLQDALLELQRLYHVDILFEEASMQQVMVPANQFDRTASLEKNLRQLLTPHGFWFKKLQKGGYVVRRITSAQGVASLPRSAPQQELSDFPASPSLQNADEPLSESAKADHVLTGEIVDEKGEGLPGVSIVVKGTQRGTTSDKDGKYSLNIPDGDAVLIFSFVGYMPQEVAVGNKTTLNITLKADTKALDEVVVVGYGTVKKKDLTGSVASIGIEQIKDQAVARVDQALLGKVAGVQVKPVSGEPGAAPQIRIRGIGSISAGAGPLYVIDGFPTDNIQTLNPNDIESMDILKDASATAIYGSRGSNGVIIINTKRGKSGKPRFTFDTYLGWQKIAKRPKFMNAKEQAQYYYDGIRNRNIDEGRSVSGPYSTWFRQVPPEVIDVLEGRNTYDVDALDEVLRTAPQHQYQLTASGGNDNIKYALSGEYFNQQGIIINSDFNRYSVRANIDAQFSKRLSVKFNLNPSYTESNNVLAAGAGTGPNDGVIAQAVMANSFFPLRTPTGDYFVFSGLAGSSNLTNPLALANEVKANQKGMRLLANVSAEYKLLDNLKLNVLLGGNLLSSRGMSFKPQIPAFFNEPAVGNDNSAMLTNWLTEYTLNYATSIGSHNFTVLGGFTAQKENYESNFLTSNKYPNNLVPSLSAASGQITNGSSDSYQWSLLSYLARVNYNYKSKYYITASIRTDGSSRFGSENKYGVFPSTALAWRISDEDFLKNSPFVSELKLRTSYGQTGNNNIGNFDQYATLNYEKYTYGGAAVGGFAPGRLANPNLTWEKQQQVNFGIDFSILKRRIGLTVDHFRSRNTDLLLNVNISDLTGFSTALQNIGEVKNSGWEFLVNTVNLEGNFGWSTDINVSTYKNEVVKLGPQGDPIYSGGNVTMIGQPIGMFYGWIADGVFKNADELAKGPIFRPGSTIASRVGDTRFRDISGPDGKPDGIIDGADQTIMGSPYPDFYYGMTNRFSYKNLSLSISLQGSQGNKILSVAKLGTLNTRGRVRQLASANSYWRSEQNPGDGQVPRPNDAPTGNNRDPWNSRYLDEGTYLRINTISLSYQLPSAFLQKLSLGSLRLYATATNPFLFTKNEAFNPDVSNSDNPLTPGIDQNNYPLTKSIVFGLNLGF